ncbi:hypothetical protein NSB1T_03810 [Coprobacter fastidiosus NSB1 = JCM 33896]|jgi:hypothetical protein|nr:hypothetical protein NSB1T_03810 [Coprobacter fastidiosus NSB1 = JCM 33896]
MGWIWIKSNKKDVILFFLMNILFVLCRESGKSG